MLGDFWVNKFLKSVTELYTFLIKADNFHVAGLSAQDSNEVHLQSCEICTTKSTLPCEVKGRFFAAEVVGCSAHTSVL